MTETTESRLTITREMRARYRAALDADIVALLDAWGARRGAYATYEEAEAAIARAYEIRASLPFPDRMTQNLAESRRLLRGGRLSRPATLVTIRAQLDTEPLAGLQSWSREVRIATSARLTGTPLYGRVQVPDTAPVTAAATKPKRSRSR